MKTIKELEAKLNRRDEVNKRCLRGYHVGKIRALKDVLGLIDEVIKFQEKHKPLGQYNVLLEFKELKKRITG